MTAVIIISSIAAFLLLIFFLLASFITAELEYDGIFKFKIKYLCFTLIKNPLSPKEQEKKRRKEEKKKRKKDKKAEKEKAKWDRLSAKKRKAVQKEKGAEASKARASANPETDASRPADSAAGKRTGTEEAAKADGKPGNSESENGGGNGEADNENEDGRKAEKPKITPELIFRIIGKAKPHVKRIFKKIRISEVYIDVTTGGDDAAKAAISYGIHCAAVNGFVAFLENTVSFEAEEINIRADFELEKTVYYGSARVRLRLSTLLHSGIWGALAVIGELKDVTALTEEDEKEKSHRKAA